jgi:hypothetical protein
MARVDPSVAGPGIQGSTLRVNDGAQTPEQQDQQVIAWLKRMTRGSGWTPGDQWGDNLYQPVLDQHGDGAGIAGG